MVGRALSACLLAACLAACGVSGNTGDLVNGRLPSNGFCGDLLGLTRVISESRGLPTRDVERLAPRFAADETELRAVRDVELADAAGTIAGALRGMLGEIAAGDPTPADEMDRLLKAVPQGIRPGVCLRERGFSFQADSQHWMELRLPRDWRVFKEPWELPGQGVVGSSIRAGRSMVSLQKQFGMEPYRWLFPTAFLGVSRSLARTLGVDDGRTAVALDRVRGWMDDTALPPGCRLTGTAPYVDGVVWGFMRRSDGCGDLGAALIEVFAVAQHRQRDASVLLLQLTGRRSGDIGTFQAAVESFHVIH
ncbi:MAG: hypothetical protein QOK40_331 [Miltoncostaeaceae bacterium]|nr:hypothetical protein [Miltoncostaeaceae bacterium]